MNAITMIEAFSNLDDDLVEKHFRAKETLKAKPRKKLWYKWGAVAACFMFIICIGIVALPQLLGQGSAMNDGGDVGYAVAIGDFWYSPFGTLDYDRFPEVHHLIKKNNVGNSSYLKFNIKEEHIGEYIGIIPAHEKMGRSEGKAYRLAEYPNYDAVIIAEVDGKYELLVCAANYIDPDLRSDSAVILDLYHLPESATSMYIYNGNDSEKIYIDESVFDEFFSIVDNKEGVDYKTINDIQWQAWCKEKGDADTGVSYDGEEFTYSSHEAREAYVEFVNRNISSLWMETNRGFKDICITFLPDFQYVDIAGGWYLLDDAETARIAELLGVTKNN